ADGGLVAGQPKGCCSRTAGGGDRSAEGEHPRAPCGRDGDWPSRCGHCQPTLALAVNSIDPQKVSPAPPTPPLAPSLLAWASGAFERPSTRQAISGDPPPPSGGRTLLRL